MNHQTRPFSVSFQNRQGIVTAYKVDIDGTAWDAVVYFVTMPDGTRRRSLWWLPPVERKRLYPAIPLVHAVQSLARKIINRKLRPRLYRPRRP